MGLVDTFGMAIANTIKTDNKTLDAVIIMFIPILVSYLLVYVKNIGQLPELIYEYINSKRYLLWNIEAGKHIANGWNVGWDFHDNNILREAIMLYVGKLENEHRRSEIKFVLPRGKHSLDNYKNTVLPSERTWVKISDTVDFYYNTTTYVEKESVKINRKIILRTHVSNGQKVFYEIVKNSIDYYKKINYADEHKRHMYMLYDISNKTDKETGKIEWKKHELSFNKKVDSLFFPEKTDLVKLIDNFTNHTGKYAISTYPKKLGLLLHGSPGTGKTSLIKALAAYTNRNIVNIPMGRIETNQQLFDILFDLTFQVVGSQMKKSLEYKDIIFVMEDIDAATDVVFKRTDKMETSTKNLDTKSGVVLDKASDSDNVLKKLLADDKCKDALNLSGILNALDGIIESENRMIVVTTNHPEKLDDAFIRPGRIDKILHMDYVEEPAAKNILSMYFPENEMTDNDLSLINTIFVKENKITPAKIEQKCSEYNTCSEILEYFKESLH